MSILALGRKQKNKKNSCSKLKIDRKGLKKEITSTRATKDAIIMAKASPASNVGAPHWNGYGTRILQTQNTCWILPHKFQVTRLWLNRKLSVNNKLISQGCNRVLHKKCQLWSCSKVQNNDNIYIKNSKMTNVTIIHQTMIHNS